LTQVVRLLEHLTQSLSLELTGGHWPLPPPPH